MKQIHFFQYLNIYLGAFITPKVLIVCSNVILEAMGTAKDL